MPKVYPDGVFIKADNSEYCGILKRIFQHQYQRQLKMYVSLFLFLLFYGWFPLEFVFTYNISLMW